MKIPPITYLDEHGNVIIKIFLVTTGDYSDYKVCGVYSTKEKADWAYKLYGGNGCADIAEFELDALPDTPPGMLKYSVIMNRDGVVKCVILHDVTDEPDREWCPYESEEDQMNFFVFAKHETAAIKIANERRVRLIALNQWASSWEEYDKLQARNIERNRT